MIDFFFTVGGHSFLVWCESTATLVVELDVTHWFIVARVNTSGWSLFLERQFFFPLRSSLIVASHFTLLSWQHLNLRDYEYYRYFVIDIRPGALNYFCARPLKPVALQDAFTISVFTSFEVLLRLWLGLYPRWTWGSSQLGWNWPHDKEMANESIH